MRMASSVCGAEHPHYENVVCELDLTHHVKQRQIPAARWWWHYGQKSGHAYSWRPLDSWLPSVQKIGPTP
jgi:hypothetical protein